MKRNLILTGIIVTTFLLVLTSCLVYAESFKSSEEGSLFDDVGRFAKVTSENSKYINKLTAFFPEDALAATIKNVDDYEDAVGGTKIVMGKFKGGLDEFAPGLKSCVSTSGASTSSVCSPEKAIEVANRVHNIGKHSDINGLVDFLTTHLSVIEDMVFHGTKTLAEVTNKLSPSAKKIVKASKSGSSAISEGVSFDILNKHMGLVLDKTEDVLGVGVDFTGKIGDEIAVRISAGNLTEVKRDLVNLGSGVEK